MSTRTFRPSTRNSWKIGFANVNSILGRKKFTLFSTELLSTDFDVFGLAETKLDASISDNEPLVSGYNFFRVDRKRGGGGVAAYVKSAYPVIRLKSPKDFGINRSDLETLTLRIGTGSTLVILVVVYIPKTSPGAIEALSDYLTAAFHSQLHRLVIMGDFNVDQLISGGPAAEASRRLAMLLASVNGIQTVSGITFPPGQSQLDLAIVGDPSRHISTVINGPMASSDHNSIRVTIHGRSAKRPPDRRRVWLWNRANWADINNRLLSSNLIEIVDSATSAAAACEGVMNILQSILTAHVPQRFVCIDKHQQWMTPDLLKLIRARDDARARWKRHGSVLDEYLYQNLYRQCRREIPRPKDAYIQRTFSTAQSVRDFWSAFHRLTPEDRSMPILFDHSDQPLISSGLKATSLNIQFAKNFNSTGYDQFVILPPDPADSTDYFVTPASVATFIGKLPVGSAPGADGITATVLQRLSGSMAPVLAALFNKSLALEEFPPVWKTVKVIPIPKPGDRNSLANYRPISLLSVISKVLEKHVDIFLRQRTQFSNEQHGFIKGRGQQCTYYCDSADSFLVKFAKVWLCCWYFPGYTQSIRLNSTYQIIVHPV